MAQLRLKSLGGVQVFWNEQDVTTELPAKAVALVIYLARHGHPRTREHLAELLWPDRSAENAFGSLRVAVNKLRRVIGDALDVSHVSLGVQAILDANSFDQAITQAESLGVGLALYQGAFMANVFVGDAREFEHWQLREAESLHERFIQASLRQIDHLQTIGQLSEAILAARHALHHAPLREDLYRVLMRLYHATGERAAALRQFEACKALLWEELGVEPDESTQATLKQVETQCAPSPVKRITPTLCTLPARLTSFVGRGDVLRQAAHALNASPLLTLSATGGAGKTRFALELAHRVVDQFAEGVCFVDLTRITDGDDLPGAVASALGMHVESAHDLRAHLLAYFQNRALLLVLDNFEHIIDPAEALSAWMTHAPRLKLLVTSREPLKLYGERVFSLAPLTLEESTQLFLERLRAVQPDFRRTEETDDMVEAICRCLEGLPLAVELAATRARVLTLAEILSGLQHRFELLTSDLRNVPARHRALFNTIDWSYALLTPNQAALFRRLAVFRGGWTREALAHFPVEQGALLDLADKNLVRRAIFGTQRYTMLETVREYALHQLRLHGEEAAVQADHARWAVQTAEKAAHDLRTSDHPHALMQFNEEAENFRAALDYFATRPEEIESYARLLSAVSWLWSLRSFNTAILLHVQNALLSAEQLPPIRRAQLLEAGGHLADSIGRYAEADTWQSEALRLYEALDDPHAAAYTRLYLASRVPDESRAQATLCDVRDFARVVQDEFLFCYASLNLGLSLLFTDASLESQSVLEEGYAICERNCYTFLTAPYHINLANAYHVNDNLPEAFALLEHAYVLSQTEDDHFVSTISLLELCDLLYDVENYAEMRETLLQAERFVRQMGNHFASAVLYYWQSLYYVSQRDWSSARQSYARCIENALPGGGNMRPIIRSILVHLALSLAQKGALTEAMVLVGGFDASSAAMQVRPDKYQQRWRAQILFEAERADAQAALQDAHAQGATMTLDALLQIAAEALPKLTSPPHG